MRMTRMTKAVLAVLIVLSASAGWSGDTALSPSLEKAKEYIEANNPTEALRVLRAYKPLSHELSLYHRYCAKAYELSKRGYDAIAHLRLAYLYSTENEAKEILLIERAEAYFTIGFHAEAAMCFKMMLRNFPNSRFAERAYLGLADSLYELGNFSDAKEWYAKAGTSLRALSGKANALNAMGRYHEAYILYQEILGKNYGYPQTSQKTLYNIGKNLMENGYLSTAKFYLTSVTDPSLKYKVASALGRIALRESQINDAIKHFTYASQTTERAVKRRALLSLADLHMQFGEQEEAKTLLLEIRSKYPYGDDYDTALFMLFQIFTKEGNSDKAGSIMEEIVLRPSPHPKALDEFERMILEAKERDKDEFLKLWKVGGHTLRKPERSDSLLKIADGLRNAGKPFLDLCIWLSRHGTDDSATQGHLLLADFYAAMGDAVNASRHLKNVSLKRSSDEISRVRAKVLYAEKSYHRAIDAMLSLKDIRPEDTLFLSDLSQWFAGNRKAVEFYEKAVVNNADVYPELYVRLADTLYESGRKLDALQYYKTALALHEKGKDLTQSDREWALYRITTLSRGEEYADLPRDEQKGDERFSRFSTIRHKEEKLTTLMNRIF